MVTNIRFFFFSSLEFCLFGTENISIIVFISPLYLYIRVSSIFVTGILRQITTLIALFCCFEKEFKKVVIYVGISSVSMKQTTLHSRLRIRILSSRAESISHSFASLTRDRYFQHEKTKFVSPRGHVIFCISHTSKSRSHNVIALLCLCVFYFTYFL